MSPRLLPGPAPFAFLRGEVDLPSLVPIAATLRGWAVAEKIDKGVGARFTAWSADLGLCPALHRQPRLVLGVCGGGLLMTIDATPVGLVGGTVERKYVAIADASAHARVGVSGPVWFRLDAGVMVPLRQRHYWYEGNDGSVHTTHQAPLGVPRLSVAIEVQSGS